jgi:hypothetical protein
VSISVQQELSLSLYGDGSSSSATFDLSSAPFTTPEFASGSPSLVNAVVLGGPEIIGLPRLWQSNTSYNLNFVVNPSSPSGGEVSAQVQVAGTSGSSSPFSAGINVGQTIQDGTITWVGIPVINSVTFDIPTISTLLRKNLLTLTFSSIPFSFGTIIIDKYGNSIRIGSYLIAFTFVYNG